MSSSRTTTKLEDYQNKLSTMRTRLSSYMKELERAREELSSPTLVRNLLDLLIPYWDRACQLVEKYENTLPIGKPADDIIEWHNFVIEVTKARSIAQDYLKKDKVDDDRRDMKQNSGARYHLNLPKWEFPKFDGDVLQFETFWEQFEDQIHRQSELRDTTKFTVDCIRSPIRDIQIEGTREHKGEMRNPYPFRSFESIKRGSFLAIFTRYNKGGGVAALHAETRSFEGFTVCGERHRSDDGNQLFVTCLFDSGCQRSLIRKDLAESLRLKGTTERLMLLRLEESHSKYEKLRCVNFRLKGIYGGEDSYPIEALCLPRITTVDANPSAANWHHLHGLNLADIFPRERTETDVLIGIDFYNRLLFRERTVGGIALPEAVNSPFGWIVSGNIPSNDGGRECITLLVKTENEYGEDDLRRFWDLEIIGVTDDKGAKDPFVSRLMKTFEETLEYGDGRYTVKLPWKPGFLNLSNNYTHALQRLFKTEASLLKDTTKSEMYSKTLKEYMTEGIIERVENKRGIEGKTWYLPHHMVLKNDQTSTKGRRVFDVSAHFGRTSLNRQLDTGPSLQRDLVRILLRFRRHRIGVQSDVSRMFLQIGLHKEDLDVTRFLWKEPGDPSHPQTFRFRRLCFRLTCSPILALAVMQHHARMNKSKWPKAAEEVLKNVYIDDLLFSLDGRTETMECNMLKDWQDWMTEIPSISEIRLPKYLLPVGTGWLHQRGRVAWGRRCIREGVREYGLSENNYRIGHFGPLSRIVGSINLKEVEQDTAEMGQAGCGGWQPGSGSTSDVTRKLNDLRLEEKRSMSAVEKLRSPSQERETQKTVAFFHSVVEVVCGFCQEHHTLSECTNLRQASRQK
ncbi:conserved hypothetical protein [Trichinella spiralis]|uniref:hypothetical protein n=1 Tax=Trichinella spiralis TaxID=6334 RepID=UPI0001EFD1A5|nr:conserved hypothetical protein [Trichinella spiralis]